MAAVRMHYDLSRSLKEAVPSQSQLGQRCPTVLPQGRPMTLDFTSCPDVQ
jgi:hypothetical protein